MPVNTRAARLHGTVAVLSSTERVFMQLHIMHGCHVFKTSPCRRTLSCFPED